MSAPKHTMRPDDTSERCPGCERPRRIFVVFVDPTWGEYRCCGECAARDCDPRPTAKERADAATQP